MREFFAVGDLQPGHKRSIVFWLGEERFDAFIEKTNHLTPRTRMIWKADFTAVLGKAYPEWLEFFRKSRGSPGRHLRCFLRSGRPPTSTV